LFELEFGRADRALMIRSYHGDEVPVDIARRLGCHVRCWRIWPPTSQAFTVRLNVDFPQARRPFPALEKRAANVLFSAPAEEPLIPETTE